MSRATPRTLATRQRLFDAAIELIGQRGAEAVTVDEIAAAAGVAKGTVYYNFGSKNELVAQLLDYGMEILMDALRRPSEAAGACSDPLAEVRGMVGRALDFIEAYPAFVRLWMGEQWRPGGTWQPVLAGMRAVVLAEIRAALERVAAQVRPAPGQDLEVVATALFGAAFMVGVDRVSAVPAKPAEPAVEAVVAVAAGAFGLGRPAGDTSPHHQQQ
ncbi:TetR/AcrR family transcriptional regulator [Sinomonas atrocyanea]|uniref:TetR/AcrR family transcriptional regulator n=1 Tax=Sinomonas atrocyanea TaxID=37927 RepID=UPI0027889656|nr:TetR/AcrR family transcriptional regulator [Sinomonas atrocyanea]MDQ0260934.1 AcrR family transcriptional regulator [Sinomonas atrocyanea]MDR6622111.1 AcrR family transcriptional regulator [Sinomonas atrocyanea]